MLVSKIDVCPPQAKKIWKFWSKIAKFAHFGVSESGVRTAFQVLAKLVLTPGPEQVLACVQHLAHLSVSIPVPTPFKRWNRTPADGVGRFRIPRLRPPRARAQQWSCCKCNTAAQP